MKRTLSLGPRASELFVLAKTHSAPGVATVACDVGTASFTSGFVLAGAEPDMPVSLSEFGVPLSGQERDPIPEVCAHPAPSFRVSRQESSLGEKRSPRKEFAEKLLPPLPWLRASA